MCSEKFSSLLPKVLSLSLLSEEELSDWLELSDYDCVYGVCVFVCMCVCVCVCVCVLGITM